MRYTHKISWKENHSMFGLVTKSFRTTEDALKLHLTSLLKNPEAFGVEWETLPVYENADNLAQLKNILGD